MIQTKGPSTEPVRQFSVRLTFQVGKDKARKKSSSRKEFYERDVQADVDEVILRYTGIAGQGSCNLQEVKEWSYDLLIRDTTTYVFQYVQLETFLLRFRSCRDESRFDPDVSDPFRAI